jgi:SnoaL-like domain
MAAFRRAVESGDSGRVLAALADNVTFHNPVMFRAIEGLDAVQTIVPHLLRTWKALRYTSELHGPDGQIGLIFTAGVGDRVAQGVDLLHLDDQGAHRPHHRHGPPTVRAANPGQRDDSGSPVRWRLVTAAGA